MPRRMVHVLKTGNFIRGYLCKNPKNHMIPILDPSYTMEKGKDIFIGKVAYPVWETGGSERYPAVHSSLAKITAKNYQKKWISSAVFVVLARFLTVPVLFVITFED